MPDALLDRLGERLPPKLRDLVIWLARLTVTAVFVYAAIPKLLDPVAFADDIANYQAFPYWSWNLIAVFVPMLELLGALALLTGVARRGAVAVLAVLDVAFIVLIGTVIFRDIDLSCGCFGHEEEAAAIGWPTLARDLVLLAGIAMSAMRTAAEQTRERASAASE